MLLFNVLEHWMMDSSANFILFIGSASLIAIISVITITILANKMRSNDQKNVNFYMYISLMIYLVLYMIWLPEGGSPVNKQLVGLGIIISLLTGAVGYLTFYLKDVKNRTVN